MPSVNKGLGMILALLTALIFVPSCREAALDQRVTTVLVVRHAEKADQSPDTELSDAGVARSRLLAQMLSRVPVAALYATQYKRTQQTLAPVSTQTGVQVQQIHSDETQKLVDTVLERHRGEVVLIAGHSNSVPDIVNRLAGTDYEALSEDDFGNLFVVTISASGAVVLPLRFGAGEAE